MLDIPAIRQALADQIQTQVEEALNVYAYLPESPALPCAVISPDDPYATYFDTFGPANCTVRFLIRVGVNGRAEDAQMYLDRMLSTGAGTTSSLVDALVADRTLGGLVSDMQIGAGRMVPVGEQNTSYFEGEVPVEIWLSQE